MFVYVQRFTLFAENLTNMKNFCLFLLLVLFLSVFSCVSVQEGDREQPVEGSAEVQPGKPADNSLIPSVVEEAPPEALPVPEIPETRTFIMGKGRVDGEKLALFLIFNSPFARPDYAQVLAGLYIEEAAHEGIDHDVAFAQMCLETGFLTFGGLVRPEWNNFCGLGAIGPEQPGLVFPDPRTGVRAHIQHLKAYATSEPLNLSLVDPRYRYVRLGSSPTIEGLAGKWASDITYSEKIFGILQRLYAFSF